MENSVEVAHINQSSDAKPHWFKVSKIEFRHIMKFGKTPFMVKHGSHGLPTIIFMNLAETQKIYGKK